MTTNEISPSEVENQRFNTAFRGFDTGEVKVFLARLAQQMVLAASRENGLQSLVENLQNRVDELRTQSEQVTADSVQGDSAGADSSPVRLDAEAALTEARAEAASIVARAHDEAARVVLRARVERRTTSDAESAVPVPDDATVRDEAKAIVNEAKAVRERILTDLAKRRRVANVQLEQLRAAREKLLESMRESRRIVDAATRDLSTAEVEARVAADVAGRRMGNEPLPTAAQIERELVAARFIGVPLLSDDDPLDDGTETVDRPSGERISVADRLTGAGGGSAAAGVDSGRDVGVSGPPETGAAVASSGSSAASVSAGAHEERSAAVRTVAAPARVDDLFARLRAEREAAADKARHVLADTVPGTAADPGQSDVDPAPSLDPAFSSAPARPAGTDQADRTLERDMAEVDGAPSQVRRLGERSTADPSDLLDPDTPYIGAVPIEPPDQAGHSSGLPMSVPTPAFAPESPALSLVADAVEVPPAEGRLGTEIAPSAELRTERLSRALKRALQDEHSAVLASIRTSRGRPELAEVLPTESLHRSSYLAIVLAAFPDDDHERIRRVGEPVVDDLIREVRDAVAAALLLSDSPEAEVSHFINGTYRAWRTERIGAVAANLVSAAVVAGSA